MLKNLFTLILVCISISASAQFYGWSRSIGGSGADTCAALAVDNQANLYILGSFSGNGEFRNDSLSDKLTASGGDDIFLQKRSKKGRYIRSKRIGGKGNDRPNAMIYHKGFIYISGTIQDTVDYGVVRITPSPKAKRIIFIAKMDTLGNFVWVKSMGDSLHSRARSLAINKDGIYLSGEVTGKLENVSYTNSMFLQKRDFNGNVNWTKTFGTKRSVVSNAITTDSLGNIYNVGGLNGTNVDFNPSPLKDTILSSSINGVADIFIQKLNANGELIWVKKTGGTAADEANTIVSKGNEFYVSGYFSLTVDFDYSSTGISNLVSKGGKDIFIGKYDLNGKLVWIKQIGNTKEENARQLEIDKYTNIYLSGNFNNSAGSTTDFLGKPLGSSGSVDAFCIKFDAQGKIKLDKDGKFLAKQFAGSGSDYGSAIIADTMNNVFISGSYGGSITLDLGSKSNTSIGTNDIFIYKSLLFKDSDIYFYEYQSSISENSLHINVYPNPVSDKLHLTFDQLVNNGTLSITTLTGQTLQTKEVSEGQTFETINLTELTPGIYFVRLTSGSNNYTYKIHKI